MVSCQDEISGEPLFSRPILTHSKGKHEFTNEIAHRSLWVQKKRTLKSQFFSK